MYIPMPFPKCKKCGKSSTQGYHRGCGGKLEFAPEKETIRCPKCAKQWNIWDTTYFCSCGNEFHSKEIEDSIVQLLYACKICVQPRVYGNSALPLVGELSRLYYVYVLVELSVNYPANVFKASEPSRFKLVFIHALRKFFDFFF